MKMTLLSLLVVGLLRSQAANLQPIPSGSDQDLVEPTTIEVEVLRAQLDATREYQQELLQTVYWSLGTVLAVAVILVGYNWFVGFQTSERDKAALRSEMESFVRQHVDEKIAADLKKQADESLRTAKFTAETVVAPLAEKVAGLTHDLNLLEYQSEGTEARYWLEQGRVPANAFDCYLRKLKVARRFSTEQGQYHYVTPTITEINQLLDTGFRPGADQVTEALAVLDRLQRAPYTGVVQNLRGRLTAANQGA